MSLQIEENSTVLFQGDSITDAGRDRTDDALLGTGYANMVAAWFQARYPERRVNFLNRGISGNRVRDLKARWQEDCLDIRPDWVSILIGVNDTWRRYDQDSPTSAVDFEQDYRDILQRTAASGPVRFIILEPFVLPTPPDRCEWREDLDPKIQVARRLAAEFRAVYVPLDGLFATVTTCRDAAFWAADGVHPSQAGHALIARAWLQAVGAQL